MLYYTQMHTYSLSQRALNLNICAAVIVNEAHCGSIGFNVNEHNKIGKSYEMKETERERAGEKSQHEYADKLC